jgi:hypothetical protein
MESEQVDPAAAERARLIEVASKRGYNRTVAVALSLAGLLPAAALAVTRPPGFDSTWLIAALFVLVPAIVLYLWVRRDPEGQDARELVMWLRTTTRSDDIDLPPAAVQAFADMASGEASIAETVDDTRDALTSMVSTPGSLANRINVFRNWYPVIWVASSLILVVVYFVFTLFTPACTSPPTPGQICH